MHRLHCSKVRFKFAIDAIFFHCGLLWPGLLWTYALPLDAHIEQQSLCPALPLFLFPESPTILHYCGSL